MREESKETEMYGIFIPIEIYMQIVIYSAFRVWNIIGVESYVD